MVQHIWVISIYFKFKHNSASTKFTYKLISTTAVTEEIFLKHTATKGKLHMKTEGWRSVDVCGMMCIYRFYCIKVIQPCCKMFPPAWNIRRHAQRTTSEAILQCCSSLCLNSSPRSLRHPGFYSSLGTSSLNSLHPLLPASPFHQPQLTRSARTLIPPISLVEWPA